MKVAISVGEASGDMYGAELARHLTAYHKPKRLIGIGGPLMREAGVDTFYDPTGVSIIGIAEFAKIIRQLFDLLALAEAELQKTAPDVLVLIDAPELNVRLAARARRLGIPTVYLFPPSAWAWRRWRARRVARLVDKVASAFHFEKEVYEQAGANVHFVGHPLIDMVRPQMGPEELRALLKVPEEAQLVALLPGSRRQELSRLAPLMAEAAHLLLEQFPGLHFAIPVAPALDREEVAAYFPGLPVSFTAGKAYDVLSASEAAVVAHGTATLETALLGIPQVAVYRLSPLSFSIIRRLVHIKHAALPNIVAGRRVIPELIQDQATAENVASEVASILANAARREEIQRGYEEIRRLLGGPGAMKRLADLTAQTTKGATSR